MPSWIVLLPPFFVILVALYTRHIIASFMAGIISCMFILYKGDVATGLSVVAARLWTNSGVGNVFSWHAFWSNTNILVFTFLICMGIIIVLLQKTGATRAFVHFAQHIVTGRRSAEMTSLLLSCIFFIDDYFSALTVGSIMRPIAQLYKIPAVKIAFLTTAMASPLAILSPLSSWIGEIILQFGQIGISLNPQAFIVSDPYLVFVHTIPAIMYPILLIIGTWYIVIRGISYGPMALYEKNALAAQSHQEKTSMSDIGSFVDFFLPLGSLIAGIIGVLLCTGNFFLFGGHASFVEAIKIGSVPQALCAGGFISLILSSIFFFSKKRITVQLFGTCFVSGFQLMFPSICMLTCAWTLGSFLKQDLQTGSYIVFLFSSIITSTTLPALSFLCASITAWLIGSAWATIGLMLPIVIEMLQQVSVIAPHASADAVTLLFPVLGATLSGSVMGTHVSFISDTPIMSAASIGADHVEHVKTMMWYILPIACATFFAYIAAGMLLHHCSVYLSLGVSLGIGILFSILFLEIGQRFFKHI
ncbi:MAG TPA: Na+/H+ antiporter NhaC family protein [Candidatus Bathyarchaeia archaeon]|nr:Na+/H+ antiporter NhaC family protein [Candidatus Bathyarchaeia archaeon]